MVGSQAIRLVPDWTLLLHIPIFLFVLFMLNGLIFQPMLRILEKRRTFTSDSHHEAERLNEEAQQLELGRHEVLAMTLREAQAERMKRITEAQRKVDRMIASARARASDIIAESASSIEVSTGSVVSEMDARARDLAKGILLSMQRST